MPSSPDGIPSPQKLAGTGIVSRFLEPPSELVGSMMTSMEEAMSGIYGIHTTASALSHPELSRPLAMLQFGRQEFKHQCERMVQMFRHLSDQSRAYVDLIYLHSQPRGVNYGGYLNMCLAESQKIQAEVGRIRSVQDRGLQAFRDTSALLLAVIKPTPRGPPARQSSARRTAGQLKTAFMRARPVKCHRKLKRLANITENALEDTARRMWELEEYYLQFQYHLQTLATGPPSPSRALTVRNGGNGEVRASEVWANFAGLANEAALRMMRAADAIGAPTHSVGVTAPVNGWNSSGAELPSRNPTGSPSRSLRLHLLAILPRFNRPRQRGNQD